MSVLMASDLAITTYDRLQQGSTLLNGGIDGGLGYREIRFRTDQIETLTRHIDQSPPTPGDGGVDEAPSNAEPGTSSLTSPPGRPPLESIRLALAEMSRKPRGAPESSVIGEARALLIWLRNNHPGLALPAEKTLANSISDENRRMRNEEH